MKLKLKLRQEPGSLFCRLSPSVARKLYEEARTREKSNDTFENGWNVNMIGTLSPSSSCVSGVEFLPLRLTFGHNHVIYASYNGGYINDTCAIEVPASLLEIDDLCSEEVDVFPLHFVADALTLDMEPLTSTDWELLESNASFLEGEFLHQLSVVYPQQVLPVFLKGRLARVRILECRGNQVFEDEQSSGSEHDGNENCIRLVANTEVTVMPKTRSQLVQSPPIRVLPTVADFSNDALDWTAPPQGRPSTALPSSPPPFTAWAHMDTLQQEIPGWSDTVDGRFALVTMHKEDNADPPTVVRLGTSPSSPDDNIPRGCIVMHQNVGKQLGVTPFYDKVVLQLLSTEQVCENVKQADSMIRDGKLRITLEPCIRLSAPVIRRPWRLPAKLTRSDALSPSSAERSVVSVETSRSAASILSSLVKIEGDFLPVTTGSVLTVPSADNGVTGEIGITYALHFQWIESPEQLNGIPFFIYARDVSFLLLGRMDENGEIAEGSISAADEDVRVQEPADKLGDDEVAALNDALFNLLPPTMQVFHSNILDDILDHILLSTGSAPFGLSCANGILLTGEVGTGKTHTSLALAVQMRFQGYATVYVDCKKLKSFPDVRMRQILKELTDAFRETANCAPSLLVLDDLDEIAPNTDASSKQETVNIQQTQINPALIDQAKLVSDHIRSLIAHFVMQYKSKGTGLELENGGDKVVHLIGTCTEAKSISSGLLGVRYFSDVKEIPALSQEQNLKVFEAMLEQQSFSKQSHSELWHRDGRRNESLIRFFSARTKGCRPRDLDLIATRVRDAMIIRDIGRDAFLERNHQKTMRGEAMDESPFSSSLHSILSSYTPIAYQSIRLEDCDSNVTWDSIGGLFGVKEELISCVMHPFKYQRIYERAPISLPKGFMLYGPSGCGKSFLVPALAKECGLNLIVCRGPELLDKYIGASETKVRQIFAQAFAAAPSLLFLDELDALAPRRGSDNTGVTDRVVNQLLTFLDGVESFHSGRTYILAATSRPDKVDSALLRPGRLEKHIYVGYPEGDEEWFDLFHKILNRNRLTDDLRSILQNRLEFLELVRRHAPHMYHQLSPADMKGVTDTASLLAAHEHLDELAVPQDDMSVAISKEHFFSALKVTKPSLSTDEIRKLARVYSTFHSASARSSSRETYRSDDAGVASGARSVNMMLWSDESTDTNGQMKTALR